MQLLPQRLAATTEEDEQQRVWATSGGRGATKERAEEDKGRQRKGKAKRDSTKEMENTLARSEEAGTKEERETSPQLLIQ